MEVTLPADSRKQLDQELAGGRYQSRDESIEQAVEHFFDERQRGQRRLAFLANDLQVGFPHIGADEYNQFVANDGKKSSRGFDGFFRGPPKAGA